nr:hypothetical protein [Tanacetum cinerariifolium]
MASKTFLLLAIIFSMILVISSEAPAANDSSLTHDSAQVEEGKGYRDNDGYYRGEHGGYDDDGGYDGGYGGYDGRYEGRHKGYYGRRGGDYCRERRPGARPFLLVLISLSARRLPYDWTISHAQTQKLLNTILAPTIPDGK